MLINKMWNVKNKSKVILGFYLFFSLKILKNKIVHYIRWRRLRKNIFKVGKKSSVFCGHDNFEMSLLFQSRDVYLF